MKRFYLLLTLTLFIIMITGCYTKIFPPTEKEGQYVQEEKRERQYEHNEYSNYAFTNPNFFFGLRYGYWNDFYYPPYAYHNWYNPWYSYNRYYNYLYFSFLNWGYPPYLASSYFYNWYYDPFSPIFYNPYFYDPYFYSYYYNYYNPYYYPYYSGYPSYYNSFYPPYIYDWKEKYKSKRKFAREEDRKITRVKKNYTEQTVDRNTSIKYLPLTSQAAASNVTFKNEENDQETSRILRKPKGEIEPPRSLDYRKNVSRIEKQKKISPPSTPNNRPSRIYNPPSPPPIRRTSTAEYSRPSSSSSPSSSISTSSSSGSSSRNRSRSSGKINRRRK
ncbi:MAG: hypothetical protein H0Z29_08935 [Candidatus Marinimicrobia bacterium]|nr:hypothetical protein [Candidatus Neomarinimicrobiota bacterium]